MPSHSASTSNALEEVFLALQGFQVAFLWVHDWVPLGRLNDIVAVRKEDSLTRLVIVTLIQSVPWTIGLFFSVQNFGHPYPAWLIQYLWITYGILLAGQFRAWWLPYLFRAEPKRAERYERMFGNTHSFLPRRHGLVPNTAHILLHLCTTATLLLLFLGPF